MRVAVERPYLPGEIGDGPSHEGEIGGQQGVQEFQPQLDLVLGVGPQVAHVEDFRPGTVQFADEDFLVGIKRVNDEIEQLRDFGLESMFFGRGHKKGGGLYMQAGRGINGELPGGTRSLAGEEGSF